MVRPVNRDQSPISTASPNAVKRGHPAQTTQPGHHGVNALSAAISVIAVSSRSRRAAVASTVS